jgi:excisionase family DNA binding protein
LTDRLLTARQLAELLGVSSETVLRWTRQGRLPGFRLPGGALRYRPEMIDAWLDQRATADGADREAPTTRYAARHPVVFPIANHPETEED